MESLKSNGEKLIATISSVDFCVGRKNVKIGKSFLSSVCYYVITFVQFPVSTLHHFPKLTMTHLHPNSGHHLLHFCLSISFLSFLSYFFTLEFSHIFPFSFLSVFIGRFILFNRSIIIIIIIIITIIINITPWEFFISMLADGFHWSLSESKSPLVSMTHLNNVVVWMVSNTFSYFQVLQSHL